MHRRLGDSDSEAWDLIQDICHRHLEEFKQLKRGFEIHVRQCSRKAHTHMKAAEMLSVINKLLSYPCPYPNPGCLGILRAAAVQSPGSPGLGVMEKNMENEMELGLEGL